MTKNNNLKVELSKRYKITKTRYLTVNNEYYVGGEMDLFNGFNLKQIQFIILCLALADNQIMVKRESSKDSNYCPNYVLMDVKWSVIDYFFGTNLRKNLLILSDLFGNEKLESCGLYISYSEDSKSFSIIVNASIFMNYGKGDFTKIYIGDMMKTNSMSSMYIKMRCYKFAEISDYIDGLGGIEDKDRFFVIISKNKFRDWVCCGKEISKYVKNGLDIINKENCSTIEYCLLVSDKIHVSINKKSFAEHVVTNNDIMMDKTFAMTEKDKKIESFYK